VKKVELDTIQQNLSYSYLHAVVSRAGGGCVEATKTVDDMGIDVLAEFNVPSSSKKVKFTSISLRVQLKSTRRELKPLSGKVSFSLPVAQYEKYRQPSTTELLFVLFSLPEDPKEWLSLTPDEMILRKCAYWTGLVGAPSASGQSTTIHIPANNLFTVEQLQQNILKPLSEGMRLHYGT
jgi:hypothetical protein